MSDPLFVPAGLAKHWENEARHAWVENARLKAEVERLRKAGDAMAETLEGAGFDSANDFWNAAKEGKPSV